MGEFRNKQSLFRAMESHIESEMGLMDGSVTASKEEQARELNLAFPEYPTYVTEYMNQIFPPMVECANCGKMIESVNPVVTLGELCDSCFEE